MAWPCPPQARGHSPGWLCSFLLEPGENEHWAPLRSTLGWDRSHKHPHKRYPQPEQLQCGCTAMPRAARPAPGSPRPLCCSCGTSQKLKPTMHRPAGFLPLKQPSPRQEKVAHTLPCERRGEKPLVHRGQDWRGQSALVPCSLFGGELAQRAPVLALSWVLGSCLSWAERAARAKPAWSRQLHRVGSEPRVTCTPGGF